jgi:phosphoribosylamine--glycine ligase
MLKGFISDKERVSNWRKWTDWADVIIFDDVGWGKEAEALRRKGKHVIGGTVYTDRLELDREFGQKELELRDIRTLREHEFSTIDEVVNFIRAHPKRYVLKPCAIHDMDATIVGELPDGSDLIELIGVHSEIWRKKRIKGFFLQEFVKGIEVAVCGTFDGKDFVYPIEVSFEHKRLFTGDLGPMTWEMGTLNYLSDPNKLFEMTVKKFMVKLREVGYVGEIDLNCIVNERGAFPLEFTCRYGFPETAILFEGNGSSSSDYLYQLATGTLKSRKADGGYNVGIVVCIPPFPYNDWKETLKYDGILIKFRSAKGVYVASAEKRGKLLFTNMCSCPLIVAAKAGSVQAARAEAYRRVKNVHIENMYYRLDIASKWEKESKLLRKWGYIRK